MPTQQCSKGWCKWKQDRLQGLVGRLLPYGWLVLACVVPKCVVNLMQNQGLDTAMTALHQRMKPREA
jgi:hypothetical protein